MARVERVREVLSSPLTPEYVQFKSQNGWKPVAVEWERESAGVEGAVEVPFGLQVSSDCVHLEENPAEMEILLTVMELIVQDRPLSQVADELNRRGTRTRRGLKWGPVEVFELLPRLVEAGPRIFTTREWAERRRGALAATLKPSPSSRASQE
jgi:hypothetical protein